MVTWNDYFPVSVCLLKTGKGGEKMAVSIWPDVTLGEETDEDEIDD